MMNVSSLKVKIFFTTEKENNDLKISEKDIIIKNKIKGI
jgi:hypothetical protein